MDLGLKDKVILLAGASKGLGYATAKACAEEGAIVSISSSNKDSIESAKASIERETGAKVAAYKVDARSEKEIRAWIESTMKTYHRIDGIFINTGGPSAGEFLAISDEQWQSFFELLVLSSIRMCRLVIPHLKSSGGSILFNVSTSVKEPIANLTLSNVLRASVSALSKTLSRELGHSNVRVNQILPGRIDTDRVRSLDSISAEKNHVTIDEARQKNIDAIPFGRYGEPVEFGKVAAFLLSPMASYITGATIAVDGGAIKSVM